MDMEAEVSLVDQVNIIEAAIKMRTAMRNQGLTEPITIRLSREDYLRLEMTTMKEYIKDVTSKPSDADPLAQYNFTIMDITFEAKRGGCE